MEKQAATTTGTWAPSNEERFKALVLLSHLFQAKPIEMTDMVIATLAGNLKVTPTVGNTDPIDFKPNFLFSHDALKDLLLVEPYNFDPKLLDIPNGPDSHSYLVNAITDGILKAMDCSFGLITPDTACAVHHAMIENPEARNGFEVALTQHLRKAMQCAGERESARPAMAIAEPAFAPQKPSASWFLEETKGYCGLEFSIEMVKYTIIPMFEHNPFRALFVLSRVDRLCKTFDIKTAEHSNAWAYVCENIPSPDVRMAPVLTQYKSATDVEPWLVVEELVFTAATRYAKMMHNMPNIPPLSFASLTALIGYVRNEDRRRLLVEMF